MPQNPILDAPAVREAREEVVVWKLADEDGTVEGAEIREFFLEDLDAYAAAILAEVRRRVEALDGHGRKPDEAKVYVLRAAVLALLDGRDA